MKKTKLNVCVFEISHTHRKFFFTEKKSSLGVFSTIFRMNLSLAVLRVGHHFCNVEGLRGVPLNTAQLRSNVVRWANYYKGP